MKAYRLNGDRVDDIKKVLLHPQVSSAVDAASSLSSSPELVDFALKGLDIVFYGFGEPTHGVCVFIPVNNVTADFHTYVLPDSRHLDSISPARDAIRQFFSETGKEKLTTTLARTAKGPLRHAKRMGFQVEGVCKRSLRVRGELVDRVYLGLGKESTCLG